MNNLGKVKLLPAREQVASILRKAILSRELQEGQEITLEGIAELVGVSTTPVREAFQILARDGLIKLRPNKGAVVQGINEKTLRITTRRGPSWKGRPRPGPAPRAWIYPRWIRRIRSPRRRWRTTIRRNTPDITRRFIWESGRRRTTRR